MNADEFMKQKQLLRGLFFLANDLQDFLVQLIDFSGKMHAPFLFSSPVWTLENVLRMFQDLFDLEKNIATQERGSTCDRE